MIFRFQILQASKHRIGKDGVKPVATGNWGCGTSFNGDVQLKLAIQWMAASLAGVPVLVYYTSGHEKLAKVSCNVNLIALNLFNEEFNNAVGHSLSRITGSKVDSR